MIIIDAPYASAPLLDYIEESQHPVLANDFSRSLADARSLNLVDDAEAVRRLEAGAHRGHCAVQGQGAHA